METFRTVVYFILAVIWACIMAPFVLLGFGKK